MSVPYDSLQQFLTTRFADRVVLTFREIEDLLGFPLPAAARTDVLWWAADSAPGAYQRSWLSANRTASPNLRAGTVLFERT